MKVYFIRHASTVGGRGIPSPQDILHISEEGKLKSVDLAKKLQPIVQNPILICSNMERANETANIVCKENSWKIDMISSDMAEVNYGTLAGKTWDEIKSDLGQEFFESYLKADYDLRKFQGESSLEVTERVKKFFKNLKIDPASDVLIFSHAGLIRTAVKYYTNKILKFIPTCSFETVLIGPAN